MMKVRIFIYGALCGWIATEVDKIFSKVWGFPFGSLAIILGVIVYGTKEYLDGGKKCLDSKDKKLTQR